MNLLRYFKTRKRRAFSTNLTTDAKKRIRRLIWSVVGILALHTLAMMWFENLSLGDAIWLSLTTINTTGYGDLSSSSFLGRTSTTVLMYVFGITVMAQLAGEYIDFVINRKEQKIRGGWSWNQMQDHIVIINTPKYNADLYLKRLITQIRDTDELNEIPVCIITQRYSDGLPAELRSMSVVHVHGKGNVVDDLERANIHDASHVIVLAKDANEPLSDSYTLDVLLRLQEIECAPRITAESVLDENRQRFSKMGADAVLRPVRAYPEMIVRSLHAHGSEKILENLFSNHGDHVVKIDMRLIADSWVSVATFCISDGFGTPLAYRDLSGKIWTNPPPYDPVDGDSLFLLVHSKHIPDNQQITEKLSAHLKNDAVDLHQKTAN